MSYQLDFFIGLGLEVLISEMDINLCGGLVTEEQQAQLYHDITAACVVRSKCTGLTFWGVNDENSWLNNFGEAMCNGSNSRSLLF